MEVFLGCVVLLWKKKSVFAGRFRCARQMGEDSLEADLGTYHGPGFSVTGAESGVQRYLKIVERFFDNY